MASDHTARTIKSLLVKYWDFFYTEGSRYPILVYEFAIDIGASSPNCYYKPTHGPLEIFICMHLIKSLLDNDWIKGCGGPWGSQIVLAAKPHQ